MFTKSILEVPHPSDGIRISVMSRHTLNDGITPDSRITPDLFDEHLPILAPKPKLIGSYYKGMPWIEFEKLYLRQITSPEIYPFVKTLALRALNNDITLLCIEQNPDYCHRRLLAEQCQILIPTLKLVPK